MIKLSILFTALIIATNSVKTYNEQDVIVLTGEKIYTFAFQSLQAWLIELYVPWCTRYEALRPTWARLANQLKGTVKIAKVDASSSPDYSDTTNTKIEPVIALLPDGPKDVKFFYQYDRGAKTSKAIKKWLFDKLQANKGFYFKKIVSQETWANFCPDLGTQYCVGAVFDSNAVLSQDELASQFEAYRTASGQYNNESVSFLWTQNGDHPDFQGKLSLNGPFPQIVAIKPKFGQFTSIRGAATYPVIWSWQGDIFKPNSQKRFQKYTGALTFKNITP